MSDKLPTNKNQSGFTLLEVMVAMVIFAILSVSGWQVFESLNNAKERANVHADRLSNLQYAYLQLQNDVNQILAWQTSTQTRVVKKKKNPESGNPNPAPSPEDEKKKKNNEQQMPAANYENPEFLFLNRESLTFMRYADPDPRFKTSATIQQIEYQVQDSKLIRKQSTYTNATENSSNTSIDSILLTDIEKMSWQVLLPEVKNNFSSSSVAKDNANIAPGANSVNNDQSVLPQGIRLSFVYHGEPVEWTFTVPSASPKP